MTDCSPPKVAEDWELMLDYLQSRAVTRENGPTISVASAVFAGTELLNAFNLPFEFKLIRFLGN